MIDKGIGIGKKDLKDMFKPFYKTKDKNSIKMNSNGHGLGLNISYRLSKLLGGNLSVESQLGVGTEFTILLPGSRPKRPQTKN